MTSEGDIRQSGKSGNEKMARSEESTLAPTPDKLDRSQRAGPEGTSSVRRDRSHIPYPLTEEEATPNVADSKKKGV